MFNWKKKPAEFVTIDDDGDSSKGPGFVSGGTLLKKKVRGSVIGNAQTVGYTPTRLDIRSERMEPEIVFSRDVVDEEEDAFMTPGERFSSPVRSGSTGRKSESRVRAGKTRGQSGSCVKKLRRQVNNLATSTKFCSAYCKISRVMTRYNCSDKYFDVFV